MEKTHSIEKLVTFITENYMVERDEVPLDRSLIDEGIIDSFGLIEIAGFLESTFGIQIKDEDMIRENFGSVIKMIDFAERKQQS
ncbi:MULTISPECIES: acyl carrier protein [Gynuella]|uniref:Acyl carrier protein n=1 Tax=Gynuella sunshinyii YC6258 TaxID=1445510 RepID=A0A0C5VPG4_9GAMM|nr:acyl carrier protein [Gynuella sunshinyii]AJQ96547.1 acyl carrier protein [Gynuella sunshinyii YC6258]